MIGILQSCNAIIDLLVYAFMNRHYAMKDQDDTSLSRTDI